LSSGSDPRQAQRRRRVAAGQAKIPLHYGFAIATQVVGHADARDEEVVEAENGSTGIA